MSYDPLVANAGRLRILTALAAAAAGDAQEFVQLRRTTELTDGNLCSHARRLASAGLIRIDKSFRDGKPLTTFVLTADGRARLERHVDALTAAVRGARVQPAVPVVTTDEDWVD